MRAQLTADEIMKTRIAALIANCLIASHALAASTVGQTIKLTPSLTFLPGPVNGALIESGGKRVVVYGDPWRSIEGKVDSVLFTHHRRDVVWAGRGLVESGAKATVPEKERHYFENPAKLWEDFIKIRLKDTAQQTTKMLINPLQVARGVKEGDEIAIGDLKLFVIDTPGFTRDAVSYIGVIDGKQVAFTGDLIYGDGQILDLYSFQDKIPEAKIGGYHGYGARLAPLLDSLRKVAALNPDIIVPARGPVIRNPKAAIEKLIGRVQELYRNYLSTNALYWYFKADRMKACAERILGKGADYELMPYSHHEEMPGWVISTGTTRILVSEDGAGFMLDCGSKRYIDFVKK
ncbi:MAG: glyoxylase-like metal-dependent hydrolase (beta-lactamase superfamily II), partial [Limisphaerales bacterium]